MTESLTAKIGGVRVHTIKLGGALHNGKLLGRECRESITQHHAEILRVMSEVDWVLKVAGVSSGIRATTEDQSESRSLQQTSLAGNCMRQAHHLDKNDMYLSLHPAHVERLRYLPTMKAKSCNERYMTEDKLTLRAIVVRY